MSLPPYITYRVIYAKSPSIIIEEGIYAGYSTCYKLSNNLIIYPYRFNYYINKDNRV